MTVDFDKRNFSQCAEEQVTSSHFFLQLLHSGWCRQVICLTLRRKCFQDLPFLMDCKCKTLSEGKKIPNSKCYRRVW